MSQKFQDIATVAELLGVSKQAIYYHIAQGNVVVKYKRFTPNGREITLVKPAQVAKVLNKVL